MRIAHLDTGREWRGGQAQVFLLLEGLRARGHAVRLLAPGGPLFDRARAAGFATTAWDPRGDLDVAAFARAARNLAADRPDVVHCHSARAHALGVPAARLARVSACVVSRRVSLAPGADPASRIKYRLGVDRYLCVSAAAREGLITAGVDPGRCAVVPSGVDLAALRARANSANGGGASLRAVPGVPAGAPLLGTVASLTREKNHAMILRAAARVRESVPEARWVWAGEGPCRSTLEAQARAFGIADRVHLLGHRSDVAELMTEFALLVVASRHEGFCGAAIEAQALGVPVVATRVGGLPEAVADGVTGVLVPDDDAAALAGAVAALLADPVRREALGRAARAHAERFSIENTVTRTIAEYERALEGPAAARAN